MSANSDNDLLDTSNMNKSLANNQNKIQVATEFYDELHSILNSKPPVSKEKVNKVIREALKSHRYYKHVVYYVENFIKNCPAEYKLSGLYVIDALIRKQNSNGNNIEKKKHQAHIDLYTKRFSINICKTFNNLFLKSPQSDRCKINRVIELWQKYNVIENDLIDKLNRISNTSKIDIALSEKPINNSAEKNLNETFLNELEKLNESVSNNGSSAKKLKPSSSLNKITTKTEISKILEFDKDFDSDSDNQSTLKRKSTSPHLVEATNPTSIFQSTAERLQNSISSCTAWLETNSGKSIDDQQIKLADFVPPAYLSTYHSSYVNSGNLPPPPPPPAPVPPPPIQKIKTDSKISPREREKERQRRGLPILKDKHLCICSKTIWLGHLSKSTNEDNVIDEITDLLSPSSSSNDSEFNSNKKRSSRSANGQNIIVDVHLIPPRGCAFVEFFDRKTASKCLDKMRDNYRLDGNYIKVAWAANRGIEKEKRLKEFWNVDVGCAYIPWEYLDSISKDLVDLSKWAIGGIVDEDSLPDKYLNVYKNQMVKISNSDPANSTKITEDESKNKSNDMEICTDENPNDQSKQADLLPTPVPPMHYQNILNSQHMLPINFSTPPPNLGQQANAAQPSQFLNSNSSLAQNQIGLSSIQVHPINYQAINQLNSVFPSTDSNHESLVPPNQNLIDLLNSQRNLMPMPNFPPAPSQFQFFHRPVLMNPNNQNQFAPLGNQSMPQMRKILLPFHGMQSQMDKNEPPINQETSEISSTTQNEEKNAKTSESRNGNFRKNNWKNNNNNHNNYNKRRSYGNDYNRNSYINNNRYSNQSNNFRNYNNNNGHNLDRK